jgi:hypothetical protein
MNPDEGMGAQPVPELQCPDRDELVRWITRVIESMDGCVRIDPQGENLCRRARNGESERIWVVEAQGLPNLLHEFVHAIFLGRLEEDHGFDYGTIPLDLAHCDHRRLLWEELACCVISAAYAERHEPEGFRLAWFMEQFEIQGVFHGLEGDLAGFRERVDQAIAPPQWRAELEAILAFAVRETRDRLLAVGAPAELVTLNNVPDFECLWDEYRRLWDVAWSKPR